MFVFMEKEELMEIVAVCYFELQKESDLYGLGVAANKEFPDTALSYFICGLYYQLLGSGDEARKLLL